MYRSILMQKERSYKYIIMLFADDLHGVPGKRIQ